MEFVSQYLPAVTLAVFAAGVALVFWEYLQAKRINTIQETYPFQNTVEIMANMHRLLDFMMEHQRELKVKTFKIKTMFQPELVITSDVDNVTHILKTNMDNYGKGPNFTYRFSGLLGEGIFNVDGEKWYNHRKTSSHLFNLNKFKNGVLETFNQHADKLNKILARSKVVDIQRLMFKFTLDSIGVIAFGKDIGALDQDHVQFAEDFDYCQESINSSFFDPFWILKRCFTPSGWEYFASLRRVDAFAYEVVKHKRAMIANLSDEDIRDDNTTSHTGHDLLSLYLSRQDKENGGVLSDKYLRDVVMNFLIAGRDTTAQALSWSFYMLGCHLDEQKKVQDEIDQVLSQSTSSSGTANDHIAYESLQEMRYLEAFCMEVLRLYPSIPKEAKHVYGPDTLPDGTQVYGGELMVFIPYAMGRDPSLWDNPLQFSPARFHNNPKPSPFVFTAFQAGPRICLGQNMAILEMKCVLARVLRNFSVALAQDKDTVTYRNSISMPIKDGLKISLSSR